MWLGFLLNLIIFISPKYEMMVSLSLVMYIATAFGIMLGISFDNIRYPLLFFILEGLALVVALVSGRLINLLYILKESLFLTISVKGLVIPFVIFVIISNILNVYIVLTLKKYQKIYSKEELISLKKAEVKISDLREKKTEEELSKIKKTRKIQAIVAILSICIFFAFYFALPTFRDALNNAFATISKLDVKVVIEYLRSYGPYAAIVSFVLMVLQSVAAPIPAFLITLSNAAIFGWVWGAILSWSSAMVGAALCFYLARALGRGVVERLTSKGAMESVDVFFERYGKYAILICRLLPFVSFDFVSYGAGLTNMSFLSFFIATGIGQLPATIVYSYVGGTLSGGAQKLFVGLLCLFSLSILIGIIKKVYNDKHKKKL